MRAMTREIDKVDADLRKLREQLHDSTWDPDELGCIRDEMDALLDKRQPDIGECGSRCRKQDEHGR